MPNIPAGEAAQAHLTADAIAPGQHVLQLAATNDVGQPAAAVQIPVTAAQGQSTAGSGESDVDDAKALWSFAVAGMALAGVGAVAVRRRKSRCSS